MLHKSKSNNMNRIKCLAVLPLIALFLMSFNTRTVYVEKEALENTKPHVKATLTEHVEAIIFKNSTKADLKNIIDDLEAKGLSVKFKSLKRNSIGNITAIKIEANSKTSKANYNIKANDPIKPIKISYNPNNETINISGANSQNAIVASFKGNTNKQNETVIIKEENKTQFYSTTQKDSVIYIIDGDVVKKEALEILEPSKIKSIKVIKDKKSIEKYGDVEGVIKIITKSQNDKEASNTAINIVKNSTSQNKNALYILNGKEVNKNIVDELKKDNITFISVLKDEKATKKYGEKGKNGVIIIETKN